MLEEDPYNDISIKIKRWYRAELEHARDTGECPVSLFCYLIFLRSLLPSDTQDIEGMNNILQRLNKLATNYGMAGASDTLCLRKSDRVSAAECASRHAKAVAYLQDNRYRFLPICDDATIPAPPCEYSRVVTVPEEERQIGVIRYAMSIMRLVSCKPASRTSFKGTAYCYAFQFTKRPSRSAFLALWSYRYTLIVQGYTNRV